MIQQRAFTLIELMVTVAIVGILASIAIPSYQESVGKSRRADAKAALLGLANGMERYFTVNNSYAGAGTGGANTGTPAATVYGVDPSTATYYDITINTATASAYTLWAAPTGAQSGDKCGTLALTNAGVKTYTGSGGSVSECW